MNQIFKFSVTDTDIFAYPLAKEHNEHANLMLDNMLGSAIKKANIFPDYIPLVLDSYLVFQKVVKRGLYYLTSGRICYDLDLKDYLRFHDKEAFCKLDPFNLEMNLFDDESEPEFSPFLLRQRGSLRVVA